MLRVALNRLIYIIFIIIGFVLLLYKQYFLFAIPIFLWVGVERIFWKNFYLGKKLLYKKKYKSAVAQFEIFLKDLEERPWLNQLGMFNIGIYTHNLRAKVYNNIGISYLESKAYKRAEEYFNKAIKEDEQFCLPYYNIAIISLIKDKEDKGSEYLQEAIKRGYNKVNFQQLKGYVHLKYKLEGI